MTRNNWSSGKLGDYITVLTDYHANGSYEKLRDNVTLLDDPDYAVMIRTTNFENNDFHEKLKYINKQAYEFLSKSKVLPNDILMNKIANAGSIYLMPNLGRPVSLAMNLFLIRTNPDYTDQKFVYYYLKANEEYVKTFASGTAAKTITKQSVKNLDIILPPLPTQRKIASILFSYQRLIETNTRRINILEEMAQTIYHEWFVNFRYPGHESERIIESEHGKIPETWEIVNLSLLVNFIRGVEPGSKNYQVNPFEDGISFIRVGDLGSRQSNIFIKKSLVQGKLLKSDDIAISFDGTVGMVKIGLEGCYSSGIRKVSIKDSNKISWSYVYFLLKSEQIQSIIHSHARGTTILHASSAINLMNCIIPPFHIMKRFETFTSEILRNVIYYQKINDKLRRSNDLLLTKLISGEIDVSGLNIRIPEAEA